MILSDFDYLLPPELIAQKPAHPRDQARLLVYDRRSDAVTHAKVADLPDLIPEKTSLVANNSRVRNARLYGTSGTKPIEALVLEPAGHGLWRCLIGGKRLADGAELAFYEDDKRTTPIPLAGKIAGRESGPGMTTFLVEFRSPDGLSLDSLLERFGQVPLPPYIKRPEASPDRYQTVFADPLGSAAAPTAGLHFTPELIGRLREKGFSWQEVTLHVGIGTFLPLRQEAVEENSLHSEMSILSPETAAAVNASQAKGGRLLAVGTTSARTLESHAGENGLQPGSFPTDLFVYPGYRFRSVDALLTNFHLPRSSLLLLVAAFLGNLPGRPPVAMGEKEMIGRLQRLYAVAVAERYRFYSFGDAMLIL